MPDVGKRDDVDRALRLLRGLARQGRTAVELTVGDVTVRLTSPPAVAPARPSSDDGGPRSYVARALGATGKGS